MEFSKELRDDVVDGVITVSFRLWQRRCAPGPPTPARSATTRCSTGWSSTSWPIRQGTNRSGRLSGCAQVVGAGGDLDGVGVVQVIEDGERLLPGVAGLVSTPACSGRSLT